MIVRQIWISVLTDQECKIRASLVPEKQAWVTVQWLSEKFVVRKEAWGQVRIWIWWISISEVPSQVQTYLQHSWCKVQEWEPELLLPAESGGGPLQGSAQVTQLHFVRTGLERRCLNPCDWWKRLWSLLISSGPWYWYPGKAFTICACSEAVSYDFQDSDYIHSQLYKIGTVMILILVF